MAGVGHLCALFQLVICWSPWDGHNLIHLEHALWQLVEITTTNNIDASIHQANLDSLEIVREICLCLHSHQLDALRFGIIQVEFA